MRKGSGPAVYGQTARRASVSLPPGLRNKPLKITNAATGEDLPSKSKLLGKAVELDLPAQEPVLIQ